MVGRDTIRYDEYKDDCDNDYDNDYETPQGRPFDDINTSSIRIEIPTPKRPNSYELKQDLLRSKLSHLYEYLDIEGGNTDLIELDRFRLERNTKTGVSILKFFNGKDWVNLMNQRNGDFLAEKSLKQKFGGLNAMKVILSVDEIPQLDKTFDATVKLKSELPTLREIENIQLQDLSTLANDVHTLTKEATHRYTHISRTFFGVNRKFSPPSPCALFFAKKCPRQGGRAFLIIQKRPLEICVYLCVRGIEIKKYTNMTTRLKDKL